MATAKFSNINAHLLNCSNREESTLQTETEFTLHQATPLSLWRFPKQDKHSTLRAWDAADEHLLKYCCEDENKTDKLAVIGDQFAALSCALSQAETTQVQEIEFYSDSYLSHQALQNNAKENNIADQKFKICNNISQFSSQYLLAKLPKNKAFLESILEQCNKHIGEQGQVLIGAKAKDITPAVIKLCKRYFTVVEPSLTWKKTRVIVLKQAVTSPYSQFSYWQDINLDNGLKLSFAPNVFSRGKLDLGAQFLLEHLPECDDMKVIDLACGNGILGLQILKQAQPKSLIFCDESDMAICSAEKNLKDNELSNNTCSFVLDDGLSLQADDSADIIVCNPPFHQQKAITDHIAKQMFKDAKRVLSKGGELRIVGNQHLGYEAKLLELFGNCRLVSSNEKFVILSAIKD